MTRLNPLLLADLAVMRSIWKSASDAPMPTKEAILHRMHVLTGLDTLFAAESNKRVPATDVDVPLAGDCAQASKTRSFHA